VQKRRAEHHASSIEQRFEVTEHSGLGSYCSRETVEKIVTDQFTK
jgi:hypothetical protein